MCKNLPSRDLSNQLLLFVCNRHGASVGRAGVLSQRAGAAGGGACVSAELEGSRAEGEQSGGGPATQTPHHRLRRLHCATLVHGWRVRG